VRYCRLFGTNLATEFSFAIHLPDGQGVPDLTFATATRSPNPGRWEHQVPIYTSPRRLQDGSSACRMLRLSGCDVLSFPQTTDFYLWPDRIVCHLLAPELRHCIEPHLLGPVFAYWLEKRGFPMLHASCVRLGERCAAFPAHHGAGKSGIAAALLQQGAALLCDDLVPIEARGAELLVHPSFPHMRMWPDEAARFLGRFEHLPAVHPDQSKRWVPIGPGGFGTFHGEATPLACLYLLDRQPESDAPIEIREVSPRDALIELFRHSFTPLLVEAAGLQPARFDLLSRLVLQVPVKRLLYPSGFNRLPQVAEAVRRDLERC
jgi:hypothetical protein